MPLKINSHNSGHPVPVLVCGVWVGGLRGPVMWQAHSRVFVAVVISISRVSNCRVVVARGGDPPPPVRRLPKDTSESTLVGLWGTRTHTDGTGANWCWGLLWLLTLLGWYWSSRSGWGVFWSSDGAFDRDVFSCCCWLCWLWLVLVTGRHKKLWRTHWETINHQRKGRKQRLRL